MSENSRWDVDTISCWLTKEITTPFDDGMNQIIHCDVPVHDVDPVPVYMAELAAIRDGWLELVRRIEELESECIAFHDQLHEPVKSTDYDWTTRL